MPKVEKGKQLVADLEIYVSTDGVVYRTDFVAWNGDDAQKAAIESALRRWSYRPYLRDGVPSPFWFTFRLSHLLMR